MLFTPAAPRRRLFVPEALQTSEMDCGPATLKAVLEGFGIAASYSHLRDLCRTDVEGTSIETIEALLPQLGLDAEQILVPLDHLLRAETPFLPAVVVTKLPSGQAHFVVVWNQAGGFVQVMDPGAGRRWVRPARLRESLYRYAHPLAAADWRAWAGSEGLCAPLRARLLALGAEPDEAQRRLDAALDSPDWYPIAALAAATSVVEALVRERSLERGEAALAVLEHCWQRTSQAPPTAPSLIPDPFWLVRPDPSRADGSMLLMTGAVVVRIRGPRETAEPIPAAPPPTPEVAAVLNAPSRPTEATIWRLLREDGLLTPVTLILALLMATSSLLIQALLLFGILKAGEEVNLLRQNVVGVVCFFAALLLLDLAIQGGVIRLGRHFEARLRMTLLAKLPRLGARYFQSRLTSDIARRAYSLRQLRNLPVLGVRFLRLCFQLLLTALGILWIAPDNALQTGVTVLWAVGLSFLIQPLLAEKDLRLRTYNGVLSRFYLDGLLGLKTLRTHSAERALRLEHEGAVTQWAEANLDFYRLEVGLRGVEAVGSLLLSLWIVFSYLLRGGEATNVLLLLYWTMSLPLLAQRLAETAQQYPTYRNRFRRLQESLDAPDEGGESDAPGPEEPPPSRGMALRLDEVSVRASGQVILGPLTLRVGAGEHVAIVGRSGAGKSTLASLLLGWHPPASGELWVDEQLLNGAHRQRMREQTAWVDPTVQVWNETLLDNLSYGNGDLDEDRVLLTLEKARLYGVIQRLPAGLQTVLGEGGGLISEGEGQQVRLGRAMCRPDVRLVLLDEPFRGLDPEQRRSLLARCRAHWRDATLLFISHEVGETEGFERVLVMEGGQIVEDGSPAQLLAQPDSRYRRLRELEGALLRQLRDGQAWRRLWLEGGELRERPE